MLPSLVLENLFCLSLFILIDRSPVNSCSFGVPLGGGEQGLLLLGLSHSSLLGLFSQAGVHAPCPKSEGEISNVPNVEEK